MTLRVRPPALRGLFQIAPAIYGYSVLGAPLYYFPAQRLTEESGLIIAGTHGDENASMVALSCALRLIEAEQLCHHVIVSVNPDGNQLGTRANANGVDLNRNFKTENWQDGGTVYRWNTQAAEREVEIGTGAFASSEPETRALCQLIEMLDPAWIVSFHEPLACVDDPMFSPLAHWLSQRMALPLVDDVGYATPGSFGTWCMEHQRTCITVEMPPISADEASEYYLTALAELLTMSVIPTILET